MSSPIAIPRSNKSSLASYSSSSTSLVSSATMSSAPTTPPSPGLYVPVHKRTGSNVPHASSSRPSSPSGFHSVSGVESHSKVYTIDSLLSLRSHADESVKEGIRAACPEVVMNRRMRKSLEFMEHQKAKTNPHPHFEPHQPHQVPAPTPTPVATPTSSAPARTLPRRNRPAGRAPERRRQALQLSDNWRSMRVAPVHPLPVV